MVFLVCRLAQRVHCIGKSRIHANSDDIPRENPQKSVIVRTKGRNTRIVMDSCGFSPLAKKSPMSMRNKSFGQESQIVPLNQHLPHGPWTFAWICCPQLPHHPCKKRDAQHKLFQRAPNPSEFAPTCTRGPKRPKQTCTNSRPEALVCKLRTGTNLHKFAPPRGRLPSGGPTRSGGCKFG